MSTEQLNSTTNPRHPHCLWCSDPVGLVPRRCRMSGDDHGHRILLKYGLLPQRILSKAVPYAFRINLNLDGTPIISDGESHTHHRIRQLLVY
jgi:hypothetical protein